MKTIKKTIEINASKQKVWELLLNDEFTRIWYGEFSPGSHADTTWEVGSKALFTDDSKGGMIATITENKKNEQLSMEFAGVVNDGQEDYESALALSVKGGIENYYITEKDNRSILSIESDMADQYFESMSGQWEKALKKLKELAEN